jgi:probable HAF family extracellular repeat protein
LNNHGEVIGQSPTSSGRLHGFIWQQGKMTDLGTLGGWVTNPVAINDEGQVIGQSTTPDGTAHRFQGQGFIWQQGKMTALGTLELHGYPGQDARSIVTAINDQGEVVGMSETSVEAGRAFLWKDGKMTDLGTLGGRSSAPTAITPSGEIVGWSDTRLVPWSAEQATRTRPFIWQHGTMHELPTAVPEPTRAMAVTSSAAEVLGRGYPDGNQLLLWQPTRSLR